MHDHLHRILNLICQSKIFTGKISKLSRTTSTEKRFVLVYEIVLEVMRLIVLCLEAKALSTSFIIYKLELLVAMT